MAEYKLDRGAIGAHEKTLVAEVVDTVNFAQDLREVEVVSDGSAAIYFTVDGSAPVVGNENAYYLPAVPSTRVVPSTPHSKTVVQLISAGTPTYSVAKGV